MQEIVGFLCYYTERHYCLRYFRGYVFTKNETVTLLFLSTQAVAGQSYIYFIFGTVGHLGQATIHAGPCD